MERCTSESVRPCVLCYAMTTLDVDVIAATMGLSLLDNIIGANMPI